MRRNKTDSLQTRADLLHAALDVLTNLVYRVPHWLKLPLQQA